MGHLLKRIGGLQHPLPCGHEALSCRLFYLNFPIFYFFLSASTVPWTGTA